MNFITNGQGWPSEYTRARQIADVLGCKVNASIDNLDETVVAVKCLIKQPGADELKNLYMDFIDDANTVELSKQYPNAKIIAITDIMADFLRSHISNEVVVLPEHTCNFKREVRTRDRVKVVGYVGSMQCFDLDVNEVTAALKKIGLKFKHLVSEDSTVTRKDVRKFYKSIDIQLAFRTPNKAVRPPIYRNPLKVFNAGSFMIPTVAFPELSYRLCAGTYFLEATDIGSIIDKCYMLKTDKKLYRFYANRVFVWSKQFDISNIARKYAELSPQENFSVNKNIAKLRRAG